MLVEEVVVQNQELHHQEEQVEDLTVQLDVLLVHQMQQQTPEEVQVVVEDVLLQIVVMVVVEL